MSSLQRLSQSKLNSTMGQPDATSASSSTEPNIRHSRQGSRGRRTSIGAAAATISPMVNGYANFTTGTLNRLMRNTPIVSTTTPTTGARSISCTGSIRAPIARSVAYPTSPQNANSATVKPRASNDSPK